MNDTLSRLLQAKLVLLQERRRLYGGKLAVYPIDTAIRFIEDAFESLGKPEYGEELQDVNEITLILLGLL